MSSVLHHTTLSLSTLGQTMKTYFGKWWAPSSASLVFTCTRRWFICYPYSRHPLQAKSPLNLSQSVMTCHSLERTQADMHIREFNLIACPLVQSSWKTPFQTWFLQPFSTALLSPLLCGKQYSADSPVILWIVTAWTGGGCEGNVCNSW